MYHQIPSLKKRQFLLYENQPNRNKATKYLWVWDYYIGMQEKNARLNQDTEIVDVTQKKQSNKTLN